jgi:hypothetical protein
MVDHFASSQPQIVKQDYDEPDLGSKAAPAIEWNDSETTAREGYAIVLLLKAFCYAEAATLIVTELSQIDM